ncbi:MAG: prepilin-type N-terminal cleavage/methylation domain-containing protein [Nanoarchaeota archaeon]
MKKGFTLAEFLVVAAIIGILSAFLYPALYKSREEYRKQNNPDSNLWLSVISRGEKDIVAWVSIYPIQTDVSTSMVGYNDKHEVIYTGTGLSFCYSIKIDEVGKYKEKYKDIWIYTSDTVVENVPAEKQ